MLARQAFFIKKGEENTALYILSDNVGANCRHGKAIMEKG